MLGKVKRRQRWAQALTVQPQTLPLCPLCGREIPPAEQDVHHFVPKSKGGRETQLLHRICHRQIHALLSETELASQFNTPQALLTHPDVLKFVVWVQRKPPDFFEKSRKSAQRRRV
jgi:hypothetical protein